MVTYQAVSSGGLVYIYGGFPCIFTKKKYHSPKTVSKFFNRSRNMLEWKYGCLCIDNMELQVVIELHLSFEIDPFEDEDASTLWIPYEFSIETLCCRCIDFLWKSQFQLQLSSNGSISKLRRSSMTTCSSIPMRKHPYFHSSTFLDRLENFETDFEEWYFFFVNMQRGASPPDETAWCANLKRASPNWISLCLFFSRKK